MKYIYGTAEDHYCAGYFNTIACFTFIRLMVRYDRGL